MDEELVSYSLHLGITEGWTAELSPAYFFYFIEDKRKKPDEDGFTLSISTLTSWF